MKHFLFPLVICSVIISACSNDDQPNFNYELLAIENATAPIQFTFNTIDTLKIQYKLPNICHRFNGVYYRYQDTTRIVAVNTIVRLNQNCTEASTDSLLTYNVLINIRQRQDYVFKLWKGNDSNGQAVFDELVVPVTEN